MTYQTYLLFLIIPPLWYDFRMITEPLFLGTFPLYAILLSALAAMGLFLSWWLDDDRRIFIIDAGLGVLLISLLGARIGFVLRNLSFFMDQPGKIPQFWLGGLTWPGAFIGAGLALLGIHLIWKENLGDLADLYLPLLGVMAFGLWLISWGTRSAYGPVTDAWFGIKVQDIFGVAQKRWPLPILGAVLSGGWIAGAILFPIKRHRSAGYRALIGSTGLIVINGLISFIKLDPAPVLWGFRWESWFSLIVLIIVVVYNLLTRTVEENEGSDS